MNRLVIALVFITLRLHASSSEFTAPDPLKELNREHKVQLVYFVPQDRELVARYAEKIGVLMTFVADIYRRDLIAKKYDTTGLDFEFTNGQPRIHLVRSTNTAAHYNGDPDFDSRRQWSRIVPELERAIGPARKHLIVAFVETYSEAPAKFEWAGGFALGARYSASGGIGMFSSWILRDDFCATNIEGQLKLFADATPIPGRVANDGRKMNSPRFEFIEDGFGAVAHELGHALGLPHDMRNERSYVMGNGFRRLRVNYLREFDSSPRVGFSPDDARFLANSRFLASKVDTSDETAPTVKITVPDSVDRGTTNVTINVEASDSASGLAGLMVFDKDRDSVAGGAEMSGTNAIVSLPIRVRSRGTNDAIELRALVSDRSGNIARASARIILATKPVSAKPAEKGVEARTQ